MAFNSQKQIHKKRGMTLVEILVSSAVFLIISLAVYNAYAGVLTLVRLSRVKITASNLANEQFEIARNLPYASVGLISGVPVGVLTRVQTLTRDGITFQVTTSIQNVDDPFDGVVGGAPNDLSPADYKQMQVVIGCAQCGNFTPLTISAIMAPKNLEAASTNGSLFIRVFDASGFAIPNAQVRITAPSLDITDNTDVNGLYDLIDAPPGNINYRIVVTKNGYSSDQTYPPGGGGLSDPANPDATVLVQQVTQKSLAIDRVSTINVSSVRNTCTPVGGIDFNLKGSKTLGTNSGTTIYKYNSDLVTDGGGGKILNTLEWDTYNFTFLDPDYDLAGTISPLPVALAPNSTQNVTMVVTPTNPRSLLMTIKDAATGLPLTNATVTITDESNTATTLITDRGYLTQTDWAGGAGQNNFSVDATKFFTSDNNIDFAISPGNLRLSQLLGLFQTSGELTSSTFDTGSASNFYQLLWTPLSQPPETGTDSVKFQVATNNDNATWNYFGPDGTAGTYYTSSNQNISSVNNGNRYLRYKLFMTSAVNYNTPSVSNISFTFTSDCVPPGQVLFSGLSAGDYAYSVSRTGYQTYTGSVTVNSPWKNQDVLLQPI